MASNLNEYYKSQGKALPSVGERSGVYASMGLGSAAEYKGTADQNTRLLQALSGGGQPAAPAPAAPAPQPSYTQAAQTRSGGGSPGSVQDLISMGYSGYQGWGNAEALADYKATGGQGKGGPSSGGSYASLMPQQPAIDLPTMYQNLYKSLGVSDKEARLAQEEQARNAAKAKINDNPFYSEGTRVGRVAKLDQIYNDNTAGLRNDIERAKADIEMQLNLQTKQFDINSQQAQMALSQFSTLLDSGALDNLGDAEIANLTRSTGLGSGIIQSAVEARRLKNLSTQIQSFDDGVDEGFVIYTIDPMGNIVNQTRQVTGKSSKQAQYSQDTGVSSFLQKYMNQNTQIGSLWDN